MECRPIIRESTALFDFPPSNFVLKGGGEGGSCTLFPDSQLKANILNRDTLNSCFFQLIC